MVIFSSTDTSSKKIDGVMFGWGNKGRVQKQRRWIGMTDHSASKKFPDVTEKKWFYCFISFGFNIQAFFFLNLELLVVVVSVMTI